MDKILKRIDRFNSEFLKETETAYQNCTNISNIQFWYARFDQLTNAVEHGVGKYRQAEDHIFELKVLNYLLKSFPHCEFTYEPKGMNHNGMDCDFECKYCEKRYLVEVKSFHPNSKKAKIP